MTTFNPPNQPQTQVIPLNQFWLAVLLPDGSVLLQYRKQVFKMDDGQIIDLSEKPSAAVENYLQAHGADRLAVRVLKMNPDGTVETDPGAVSPAGIPTNESFQLLGPPVDAIRSRREFFAEYLTHVLNPVIS
jgi:hypothetical protein